MKTDTSIVAHQYRLMDWADQIRDCQARPDGMSVAEWCDMHSLNKHTYYYRLSQVRKACLEQVQDNTSIQNIVPVKFDQLQKDTTHSHPSLELTVNGFSIHVTESTSDELLERVLRVAANVK